MMDFLGGIIAAIVEAILQVFTSSAFVKMILAAFVYVFLFAIIPMLIKFLVPDSVLHAVSNYASMLSGGASQLVCAGTQPLVLQSPNQGAPTTISCDAVVDITQVGQGVAYVLGLFQFGALMEVILPVLAVRFLFKRI